MGKSHLYIQLAGRQRETLREVERGAEGSTYKTKSLSALWPTPTDMEWRSHGGEVEALQPTVPGDPWKNQPTKAAYPSSYLSSFYFFICVCCIPHMQCASGCACPCMCKWGPVVNIGWFPLLVSILFLRQCLSLYLEFIILTSLCDQPLILCLCAGITGVCSHINSGLHACKARALSRAIFPVPSELSIELFSLGAWQ